MFLFYYLHHHSSSLTKWADEERYQTSMFQWLHGLLITSSSLSWIKLKERRKTGVKHLCMTHYNML
ncbi:hypothetical protein AT2G32487 [Arabidopsis thaliana]|uniref:Uncharacterized protein n=1 Tax=Arabidopsis thaliana TaxID=3702 RepID=A0A1P8B0F8_ARATH|nr:uncharacterized protein AT2G32487 [Arabidopsis thaliana]ANM62380.1 hypothetical protein AT2G32487 [Arabidopsis thaliana]|eukprot:NP_001077994.2 hypothetical protein AT2G32487 [Arabidopsis thaliana]